MNETVTFEPTTALVTSLLKEQFPTLAKLPVRGVRNSGWDNRTFHLGDELLVRLPSAAAYADNIYKEQRWLPWLRDRLPIAVPEVVGCGKPSERFPWPFSIHRWLPGELASTLTPDQLPAFAESLAAALTALQQLPTTGGPVPGLRPGSRGRPLEGMDAAVDQALDRLLHENRLGQGKRDRLRAVWHHARSQPSTTPGQWLHGDVAAGNLLVTGDRLSALIDFSGLAVGDPASDTVIAWTLFDAPSRAVFSAGLGLDDGCWARGMGWALWKALIVEARLIDTNALEKAAAPRVLAALGDAL
ncbi:MAG: aminoglycoside phosphotransferase family protein [Pseudomonadota bacterium]